jgi:sulfate adenylyltransferase
VTTSTSRADSAGIPLVDLVVPPARKAELRGEAVRWPSWRLTPRQCCDLELLANGGFSPLTGFLGPEDYAGVRDGMRLSDGTLWPMPIMLDVPERVVRAAERSGTLALHDTEGVMLAALHVDHVWQPDLALEAQSVFGSTNEAHPGVDYLLHRTNPWYVSGRLEVFDQFEHSDFPALRYTPAQLRQEFARLGWDRVIAFNTRNPMHRAHMELTLRGARLADAKLLLHPVVGLTQPGDVDHYTRVRCYQALLPSYPPGTAMLSLLPLAMRMGGPREALWHALIRRNYGATHFIVGRDHAGPKPDRAGNHFYRPYQSQELAREYEPELGVQIITFPRLVYVAALDSYVEEDKVPSGTAVLQISGTEQRRRLHGGEELPEWFTPPAVARELRRRFKPPIEQGFTVFFTGLSGAGKSTIANALVLKLRDLGGRSVSLLDGDEVRQRLSSELGFSHADRDRHVLRIGYVAAEVTRSGGVAVCAPIAPYAATRSDVRRLVEAGGGFVLVYVNTPLEVCEQRDRKGLYAKARAGVVAAFTGISDRYEAPTDAEIVIDTQAESPEQAVQRILDHLSRAGYVAGSRTDAAG